MILKAAIATTLLLLFIFSACSSEEPVRNTPANTSTPAPAKPAAPAADTASGGKLFADNCVICHKEDGTGGKVTIEGKSLDAENLTEAKIKNMSDEKISGYILNGIEDEGMPSFKGKLSEAQIREVVRYIRTDIQKVTPKETPDPSALSANGTGK